MIRDALISMLATAVALAGTSLGNASAKIGQPVRDWAAAASVGSTPIEEAMRNHHVPGVAIAYVSSCTVTRVDTYGVEHVGTGRPVTKETGFEGASLSKVVFSYIVMKLVEEGAFSLDDAIASALTYPRIANTSYFSLLTPRIILAHQSGLPNWAGNGMNPDRKDELDFSFEPGSAFGYSGEAYQLLQNYIEVVMDRPLEELFRESLDDLMPATSYSGTEAGVSPAFGHDGGDQAQKGRPMRNHQHANAAHSLSTVVGDFAQFVAWICAERGLNKESYKAMLAPRVAVNGDAFGAEEGSVPPESIWWSLGWGVQQSGGREIHFHWGNNGVFKNFVAFDRANGTGVVYFTNGKGGLHLIQPIAEPVVGDVTPIVTFINSEDQAPRE